MKYIKKILSNGITIVLVPMKTTNVITAGFFLKAGSRDEDDDTNGMAHFLEHMMFKGTKSRTSTELFKQLDTIGAEYNAATTMENTYYYIYGNSADTKKILDIMLDIYINPIFSTSEINKEKKVIIEEMKMRYDRPYMKLYSAMHSKMFESTPLARDIIGTEENILNFKKKDFVNFRNELYQPESTVIVVAGNFNPAVVYKWIEKAVKPLKNNNLVEVDSDSGSDSDLDDSDDLPMSTKEIIFENMSAQTEPFIHINENNSVEQVYLLMAFPLLDMYKKYNREIELLAHVLTSGSSSRLYASLREKKGITYGSSSEPFVYTDAGVFVIKTIINPTEFIPGLKIIFKELRKLKNNPIDKDELKKAVNITNNETLFSLARPIDYLIYFGSNFLENREFKPDIENEMAKLKKVKRDTIQKVASDIFTKSKLNMFLYGNIKKNTDFDFIKL